MKAILYVKGVKTKFVEDHSYQGYVIGGAAQPGQFRVYPDYKVIIDTKCKSVLPEDQKALVQRVRALAVKHGFELKVIDVTKGDFLDRLEDKLKGISSFPTLITDKGHKIEGEITEERIKALFVNSTRKRGGVVRAF